MIYKKDMVSLLLYNFYECCYIEIVNVFYLCKIIIIGTETWNDGSSYKGNYVNGKKEGFGTYCWADGSKYEGDWYENKVNGSVS